MPSYPFRLTFAVSTNFSKPDHSNKLVVDWVLPSLFAHKRPFPLWFRLPHTLNMLPQSRSLNLVNDLGVGYRLCHFCILPDSSKLVHILRNSTSQRFISKLVKLPFVRLGSSISWLWARLLWLWGKLLAILEFCEEYKKYELIVRLTWWHTARVTELYPFEILGQWIGTQVYHTLSLLPPLPFLHKHFSINILLFFKPYVPWVTKKITTGDVIII